MDTYTIPSPETGSTVFTNKVWKEHGHPKILILEEGWTEIDHKAFSTPKKLLMIRIPESVVNIRENAFKDATKLYQVVFVENSQLHTIGNEAFSGATSLDRIQIPASVTDFGHSVFSKTSSLKEVTFEEGSRLTYIGDAAFAFTPSLTKISIPDGVANIRDFAFFGATSLETIHIPVGLVDIGNGAFNNTSMLTEMAFKPGSQISRINRTAFEGSGLTKVIMGEPIMARLNAARSHVSNMPPLIFGTNNFYGKDNVSIFSRAQQIATMHDIVRQKAKQKMAAPPEQVINKIGEMLTGIKPQSDAVVEAARRNGIGGKKRTIKRGIRSKSTKQKINNKKGKSKRRKLRRR
jgi:hypothetical protein